MKTAGSIETERPICILVNLLALTVTETSYVEIINHQNIYNSEQHTELSLRTRWSSEGSVYCRVLLLIFGFIKLEIEEMGS